LVFDWYQGVDQLSRLCQGRIVKFLLAAREVGGYTVGFSAARYGWTIFTQRCESPVDPAGVGDETIKR